VKTLVTSFSRGSIVRNAFRTLISSWPKGRRTTSSSLPHSDTGNCFCDAAGKYLLIFYCTSALLICFRYLYERECYDIARPFIDAALETFEDKNTLSYASAVELSGLLDLDMMHPEKALASFERALDIRKQFSTTSDSLIPASLNTIALAYTEMGKHAEAYDAHQSAITLRLNANSDRIGNSYSNMSSLLLKMGRPDEAEEMLKRCPSLKDFTDETFIKTGNPRFSGDMVLLSRIRVQQGRLDEALHLASKALAFRQRLLGNRLKTCDSLYDVASLLHMHGNTASAM
jgi:tetratricopeptide (TPR) repeat protein